MPCSDDSTLFMPAYNGHCSNSIDHKYVLHEALLASLACLTLMSNSLLWPPPPKAGRCFVKHTFWELKGLVLLIIQCLNTGRLILVESDGVNEGVIVERWKVRVFHLNVHDHRVMVGADLHPSRPIVVQVWERHLHRKR